MRTRTYGGLRLEGPIDDARKSARKPAPNGDTGTRQQPGRLRPVLRRCDLQRSTGPSGQRRPGWALTGPRLFLDLTTDRGWQPGLYEDWLTRMLTANLLTPASHAPAPSQIDAT
jgi:hypothetical protein